MLARYYVACSDAGSQQQSVLARKLRESGKSLYVCTSVAIELAISALADGFDFADALHHASCRHCTDIATFDDRNLLAALLRQVRRLPRASHPAAHAHKLRQFAACFNSSLNIR